MSNEIILDIETVKDAEMHELYRSLFPSKKKGVSSPALHPCTCKIVAIGVKPVNEDAIVFTGNEKDIILGLKSYLEEKQPSRIITFNGVGFDFPVIRMRALKHGIFGMGKLLPAARSYRCYDIFQRMKYEFPMSLSELSFIVNGSPKDMTGDAVEDLYRNGEIDKIVEYNKKDLELTEQIYLLRDDLISSENNKLMSTTND